MLGSAAPCQLESHKHCLHDIAGGAHIARRNQRDGSGSPHDLDQQVTVNSHEKLQGQSNLFGSTRQYTVPDTMERPRQILIYVALRAT